MSEKKTPWHVTLIQNINSLGEELGLDDYATGKLRDFMMESAKNQYKSGNKAGIAWAFKKVREEKLAPAT